MTKLFLDCEMTGLSADDELVSIALVGKKKEFYAELSGDWGHTNEWVTSNVIEKLGCVPSKRKTEYIRASNHFEVQVALRRWLLKFKKVRVICDVYAHDWLHFTELFGGAMNIPGHVNYIPLDFATMIWLATRLGLVNEDDDTDRYAYAGVTDRLKHNALADARVLRKCYKKLKRELEDNQETGGNSGSYNAHCHCRNCRYYRRAHLVAQWADNIRKHKLYDLPTATDIRVTTANATDILGR